MHLNQHGTYKLWRHKNVIYAELNGTWNDIAAQNFSKEFKEIAKDYTQAWGHLVYLDEWELCSPEVFEIIEELVSWCLNKGLTRAAQVYSPSIIKKKFLGQMVVEQHGLFKRAVFDCPEKATAWLKTEGFEAVANKH